MNKLLATLHGIRLAGLGNSLKALAYTGVQDKLDAKFAHTAGTLKLDIR